MEIIPTLRAYSQGMYKRAHKILFYAMLFCVYAIFFSVESFYNFEGQPRGREDFRYSVVKCIPLQAHASSGFRLNKRFHPEVIPPCPIVSPVAFRCLIPVRLGSPDDHPLPDIAIVHYSLRGPPLAA